MKALFLLPDPTAMPDRWTQRSFELRNAATIARRCYQCGAGIRNAGIDHREIRHSELRHRDGCRCSDDAIRAHLQHRGLELDEERYLVIEAQWDEEGAA